MIQEQKHYHGNQLFMQLEDWVVDILMSDELTKTDHRLFWYLFKLERWGDRFIELPSQSEIALALSVSRQSINQSQAKLQELGLWDFKTTGWKARNLVGPKSYTISEKTDAESEKNETDIYKERAHAILLG
jgi:biotin operon repressor